MQFNECQSCERTQWVLICVCIVFTAFRIKWSSWPHKMQEKKCQSMIIYLLVMDLINLAETEEREGEGKIGKN